jgi:hypothetical protein
MRLGNRDKILGVKKSSHPHHVVHGPAPRFPHVAIEHGLFFVV